MAAMNVRAESGTVRVLVPDQTAAKDVRNFLLAFLEQPSLKHLLVRTIADGVELTDNVLIEITSNPQRLARGVITTISLVERPIYRLISTPATWLGRPSAAPYVCPSAAEQFEEMLGLPPGQFAEWRAERKQLTLEMAEAMRESAAVEPPPVCNQTPTSVPVVRRQAPMRDCTHLPFIGSRARHGVNNSNRRIATWAPSRRFFN